MSKKKVWRAPAVKTEQLVEVTDAVTGRRFVASVEIPEGDLIWVRLPVAPTGELATRPTEEWELLREIGR